MSDAGRAGAGVTLETLYAFEALPSNFHALFEIYLILFKSKTRLTSPLCIHDSSASEGLSKEHIPPRGVFRQGSQTEPLVNDGLSIRC